MELPSHLPYDPGASFDDDGPAAAIVLEVYRKTVYGNDLTYPHNDVARAFCAALGTKTLTAHHLACVERMGLSVVFLPTY